MDCVYLGKTSQNSLYHNFRYIFDANFVHLCHFCCSFYDYDRYNENDLVN